MASEADGMQFVQKSEKDIWQTPPKILDPIQRFVGIDIDPCPGEETEIGQEVNLRWPEHDGLNDPWEVPGVEHPTAFVNPPFSAKGEFLQRGIEQYQKGNVARVFFLLPDSTDVKSWWHGKIATHCQHTWFPRGRVNYVDPTTGEKKNGVSFGSSLSILGDIPNEFARWMAQRGDFTVRPYPNEFEEDPDF